MPSLRSLLTALGGVVVASSHADPAQQVPLTSSAYVCEHPPYKVSLVSKSPLIIYLQNFLTPSERAHLLDLGYVHLSNIITIVLIAWQLINIDNSSQANHPSPAAAPPPPTRPRRTAPPNPRPSRPPTPSCNASSLARSHSSRRPPRAPTSNRCSS